MFINGEIKEHRIQIDADTNKPSMAMRAFAGKSHAERQDKGDICILAPMHISRKAEDRDIQY